MNIPIRLIALLPMLLLVAALIATACESATPQTPDAASQGSAIAAAAPTTTPTPTPTVTPTPEHTQTQPPRPTL